MTANRNELLSALVDGELQADELEQALQILTTDQQAKQQLQRYQCSSDVLHGYGSMGQTINLTERIASALANEPSLSNVSPSKQKAQVLTFPQQFWKQTASLAIAASVGALAVMGVMTQPQSQLVPAPQLAAVEQAAEIMMTAQSANRWTVSEAEVEERLNTYLLDHNEYTGASNVFSYARVVSYGAGQ
ncbi:MAG: sigma-E factor negative regulatory protein [Methylophagaceae bacterium]